MMLFLLPADFVVGLRIEWVVLFRFASLISVFALVKQGEGKLLAPAGVNSVVVLKMGFVGCFTELKLASPRALPMDSASNSVV